MRAVRVYIAVLLLSTASIGRAATNILGPKTYGVTAGSPQVFTETITVDAESRCDGKATYILSIVNHGVASARVTLNAAPIFVESDFNAAITNLESPVALLDSNILSVQLKGGQPGSSLELLLRREIELKDSPLRFALTSKQQTFSASPSRLMAQRSMFLR